MRRNYFSLLGRRRGYSKAITDPAAFIAERAMRDERVLSAVQFMEAGQRMRDMGGWYEMADGIYYRDLRQPFLIADAAAVTITTAVCVPAATTNFAFLPANYFGMAGKTVKHTQFGKMTTGATPGNGTPSFSISNTDNTRLKSGAAVALQASKTDASYRAEGWCTCRTAGASGTAMIVGQFWGGTSATAGDQLWASPPVANNLIPSTANATVTFDSTASQGFNFQFARSGSTTETMTAQALYLEALS